MGVYVKGTVQEANALTTNADHLEWLMSDYIDNCDRDRAGDPWAHGNKGHLFGLIQHVMNLIAEDNTPGSLSSRHEDG